MTTQLTIRSFTQDDYPAIAELLTAVWPEYPTTAEAMAHDDGTNPQYIRWNRLVALEDGKIVGQAEYTQFLGMYHPQKFGLWVSVHPLHRQRGIGKLLYAAALKALEPYDPISLLTSTREDQTGAIHWLHSLGFQEVKRYWESRLEVNSFDPVPFAGAEEKVRQHGLEITTLAELAALEPETYQRKFYDLWCEIREDVPRPEPATPVSFEEFHKWTFESPRLLPKGTFVAVDPRTGAYVGLSQLWKPAGGEHLETGLTGVRRAYRRKGLALAMKLRAVEYAKHVGAPEIRTGNESNNRPMLAINEALGFKKQPAWIDFVKVLKEK